MKHDAMIPCVFQKTTTGYDLVTDDNACVGYIQTIKGVKRGRIFTLNGEGTATEIEDTLTIKEAKMRLVHCLGGRLITK